MYWETLSTNPQQHDSGYAVPNNEGWYQFCGKPKQPNAMAMNQAQYHASVVWRTDSSTSSTAVADQIATFTSHLGIHVADNWCKTDLGLCCSRCCDSAVDNLTRDLTWSLDLGAVIPIPVSILFGVPEPASVGPLGGTIKGLIVLASPAKADTLITGISSNSPHASPKTDRVVVYKGEQTASFDIDVNADGIAPGQYFTAEISAFYARTYRESLTMQAAQ
jgi:hypothetical protein